MTEEYDDLQRKLEAYLSTDRLPENLDEDQVIATGSQVKTIYHEGVLLAASLSTASIPPSSPSNVGAGGLINELPKLSLATFDGRSEHWLEFYSKFVSLVDENPALTLKQKLLYLVTHLKGEAYDKVAALPITDDSYAVALSTLKARYHNPRLAAKIYCSNLLQLPSVSIRSASSIRKLVDTFNLNYRSLQALRTDDIYQQIYALFLLSKLDLPLRERFEAAIVERSRVPDVADVIAFLTATAEQREHASLEVGPSAPSSARPARGPGGTTTAFSLSTLSTQVDTRRSASNKQKNSGAMHCPCCDSNSHNLWQCSSWLALTPKARYNRVRGKRCCLSCLRKQHSGTCGGKCKTCGSTRHHTLLHFGDKKTSSTSTGDAPAGASGASSAVTSANSDPASQVGAPVPDHPPTVTLSSSVAQPEGVLLATCLALITSPNGGYLVVRAILDTASHASFLSEACAIRLGGICYKTHVDVSGVGDCRTRASKLCHLAVSTLTREELANDHPFIILPKISTNLPRFSLVSAVKSACTDLVLADPTFDVSAPIDALLGADIVASALSGEVVSLGKDLPVAVNTKFGFVIMGKAPIALKCNLACTNGISNFPVDLVSSQLLHCQYHSNFSVTTLATTTSGDLSEQVGRFWELEQPPVMSTPLSEEDVAVENFYVASTRRLPSGRYQVRLPFRPDAGRLGTSLRGAMSRFLALERKFQSNATFKQKYVQFMRDYTAQGHMTLVTDANFPKYFIPHHGIFKTRGESDKLRVVFDAAMKTSSGASLNDLLSVGPKLQALIADVVTLFRRHRYVFTCDIEQMYRQILIHPDDCAYLCILWREEVTAPLQVFALQTVTYGLTCAPYQALRTLRQLALDEGPFYPRAASVLTLNTFVDDIAAGADCEEDLLGLRSELVDLLARGGFTLKKWCSNHPLISPNHGAVPHPILGLMWCPSSDSFSIPSLSGLRTQDLVTKRLVLSQLAQLYDPCGWLAPFIFVGKAFFQKLWIRELEWDTPLDPELSDVWRSYVTALRELHLFSLPRPLTGLAAPAICILHGFCDASQLGYAAVLYLVSSFQSGPPVVALIAAKTKVAPLKAVSIPRLELLGAYLLANLVRHYSEMLSRHLHLNQIALWTDSTIVVNWINTPTYKLKTFVANRVAAITEWTRVSDWRHIAGESNPADLASRGVALRPLLSSQLWWSGPDWMRGDPDQWPLSSPVTSQSLPELEREFRVTSLLVQKSPAGLFDRLSSWPAVVRATSVIMKWISLRRGVSLSDVERRSAALVCVVKYIQREAFGRELQALRSGGALPSRLRRLTPYLDELGIIRVRGRLGQSVAVPCRCPVVLPKDHRLTELLIHHTHLWLGHAGLLQVQYQLSRDYWILAARQKIRSVLFKCVTCFKARPQVVYPLMGDLPAARVNPAPPFYTTGMDYAGPFILRAHSLRKAPSIKAYLCIFICFATKAVHLEVAQGLSAAAFLDVLQRFISRRGKPHDLYSDCGRNFVGAHAKLKREMKAFLTSSNVSSVVSSFAGEHSINFHFIPPAAPHQGGLWERAVKSAKYHLERMVGARCLTLFNFATFCTRIEGILNSRPLTSMSSDPGDLQALTPGHFLIGRPIVSPPEPRVSPNDGSVRHFALISKLLQSFWERWRLEYLSSLHARSKWSAKTDNLEVGDLVILHEPNCPPLMWPLGRVSAVYPGGDGIVRRASVTTASGTYDRPAVKLYRLPVGP